MPEGHTVHRLAHALGELFAGQKLAVSSPQGRFADGAAVLDGARLVASEAWGKHLFLGFAAPGAVESDDVPDLWLRVHLGLYGAWTFAGDGSAVVEHAIGAPRRRIGEVESAVPDESAAGPAQRSAERPAPAPEPPGRTVSPDRSGADSWNPPEPRGAVRVRLLGEHAVADLNGPTACEVIDGSEKRAVEARLGPDPLRGEAQGAGRSADVEAFVARVGRTRTDVGRLLMDQAVVAGVGNIYRAEALFRAGLDPLSPGRDVPAEVLRSLYADLAALMADGVRTGRIVTTREEHRGDDRVAGSHRVRQNTDGDPGAVPREQSFYVYHREGLPCRVCGSTVLVRDLAGRTLFWCPSCQV
ncbi:formamidopyrimidine-DNA glycosylase [Paraoerskovia sediminicola]|uniref:DNA-(apurinic or apyrimidinic site) lyase n=1 Tax=Paraoerskovia sediminicola TaxID=1138587 RepID=A0ABM8G761_9CELL|nr:DNA-formamidopyrimidine glycosylase family protein [Paraoerskovia sediminicola]BDZ40735.1 formamidopyrimidine-DNA glycosylase [Paraoerskovia sediminicola]BDZ44004.1 formamidopyrimidine-DNA glycosylase [Paraoerskovia sediminicola]